MVQVAAPGEIVALVTFEITLGNEESGLASLCIPYPVLEGILGDLTSQHIFNKKQDVTERFDEELLQKMQHATVPANVLLGGTQITMHELMNLQVGDVVKLDRNATEELLLCINHKAKFLCRPGTRKNKLAVAITENILNVEAIRGFALEDPARESKDPNLTEWDGMTASFDNLM
jgi:flagellar motor switch protein FliM